MIKIYRVTNGDDLTIDEEREKVGGSFNPSYVHIRNDEGDYIVVVMTPDVHEDYTPMTELDPDYDEIHEWVAGEGFEDEMFDDEITGSVH
jgi:hypothetical protein